MEQSVRRKLVRRTREPQRKRTRFGLVTQPESEESARDDEPATGGEATGICSHRAFRGGWGQRAWTDQSRNLGDPSGWCGDVPHAEREDITVGAAPVGSRKGPYERGSGVTP